MVLLEPFAFKSFVAFFDRRNLVILAGQILDEKFDLLQECQMVGFFGSESFPQVKQFLVFLEAFALEILDAGREGSNALILERQSLREVFHLAQEFQVGRFLGRQLVFGFK